MREAGGGREAGRQGGRGESLIDVARVLGGIQGSAGKLG